MCLTQIVPEVWDRAQDVQAVLGWNVGYGVSKMKSGDFGLSTLCWGTGCGTLGRLGLGRYVKGRIWQIPEHKMFKAWDWAWVWNRDEVR